MNNPIWGGGGEHVDYRVNLKSYCIVHTFCSSLRGKLWNSFSYTHSVKSVLDPTLQTGWLNPVYQGLKTSFKWNTLHMRKLGLMKHSILSKVSWMSLICSSQIKFFYDLNFSKFRTRLADEHCIPGPGKHW